MKKWLLSLCLLLIFTLGSYAEEQLLDVSVYKQGLVLNGVKVNSAAMQYPLLFYKDVVYMPLSTEMGSAAGFAMTWNDAEKTLSLTKAPTQTTPSFAWGSAPGTVKATVSGNKVQVDGKPMDFGTFPVLAWNHVTYVPLSWAFTHDVMGWQTAYNSYAGFILQTDASKTVEDVLAALNLKYYEGMAAFMRSRNGSLTQERATELVNIVKDSSEKHGIDPLWIMAIFWQESNFNPGSVGSSGIGAMQMTESTGRGFGYTREQLLDPAVNIDVCTRYISGLKAKYNGDLFLATIAYNQGAGTVSRGSYSPRFGYEIQKKYDAIKTYVEKYMTQ